MQIQLFTHQWLALSSDVRLKLQTIFNIKKSGVVTVEGRATGTVVLSDGVSNEDLAAITVEKMQAFLTSTETDFYTLFDAVVIEASSQVAEDKQTKAEAEPVEPEPVTADSLAKAIGKLAHPVKAIKEKVKKIKK